MAVVPLQPYIQAPCKTSLCVGYGAAKTVSIDRSPSSLLQSHHICESGPQYALSMRTIESVVQTKGCQYPWIYQGLDGLLSRPKARNAASVVVNSEKGRLRDLDL